MRAAPLRRPAPETWASRRVVVVVAHPDDEVLGCGALLATLRDVRIVQVTNGAPRSGGDATRAGFATPAAYAAARRAESLAALALAGVEAARLDNLGVDDQQAPHHLAAIVARLQHILADAEIVLTHAYEGGHGDHDAVAFATQAALRLAATPPALVEMPFYHGSTEGWVRQRFLPRDGDSGEEVATRVLSPEARALKAGMIAAHASQGATLAAFAGDAELFRFARQDDFTARPHDGPLLYERHGWNLTWPRWQARVREAKAALGLR